MITADVVNGLNDSKSVRHGTRQGYYQDKCRCSLCRAAKRTYLRELGYTGRGRDGEHQNPLYAAHRAAVEKWKRNGRQGARPSRPTNTLDGKVIADWLDRIHMEIYSRLYWDVRVPDGKGLYMRTSRGPGDTRSISNSIDRRARHFVASYVGELIGLTPGGAYQNIRHWRKGGRITIWNADRICAAFGRHLSELYGPEWEGSGFANPESSDDQCLDIGHNS